ncbi:MAG: ABC transporter ATP-binding protein [Ruminococcus sp.]|nr:ABC transporter ATP-binding protein [Ruminococcus sp.]
MIEVKNLTKKYGDKVAVNDISFKVEKGEILGFLGPNGAGKSTTMNMLTGYISSSSGRILINGVDILEDPKKAKSFIGYLPEIPPLYVDMTVDGYLNFMYDLKKCKLPRKAHLKDVCDLCKITDVRNRIIKNLSKGYRQRVGLAQALIGNPPVLILDEPTVGLDPNQIIEIRTLIKKLGKNHTVILSSHILPEIQAVCDKIIIINKGVVAADGTADEIAKNITNEHKMTIRIEGTTKTSADKDEIVAALRAIDGVKYVRADMERETGIYDYDVESEEDSDIRRDINKVCSEKGWNVLMMQLSDLTLEDIFMKITVGDGIEAEAQAAASKPKVRINLNFGDQSDDDDDDDEDNGSEENEDNITGSENESIEDENASGEENENGGQE